MPIVHDLGGFRNQRGALLDQPVGAATSGIERRARQRIDVAPRFRRKPRRDQRALTLCRFNDQKTVGDTRYQPVTASKILGPWLQPMDISLTSAPP